MEVQIISGFLGTGKTTFINKYIENDNRKIAIIENEFGDVSLDTDLITKDAPIKELKSGCICCSLAGDFESSIIEISDEYSPELVIIEPSGLARLSDVERAVRSAGVQLDDLELSLRLTIVDATCFFDFVKEFGPFYIDQIERADIIFLSFVDEVSEKELEKIKEEIKDINPTAELVFDDFRQIKDDELKDILAKVKNRVLSDPQHLHIHAHFDSISFENLNKVHSEKFTSAIKKLLKKYKNILRIKGIIEFDEGYYKFDGVRTRILTEPSKKLPTRIIFIGEELDKEQITELLKEEGVID